jgi:hypothetical protein
VSEVTTHQLWTRPTFDLRVNSDKIFQSSLPTGSFTLSNNTMDDNRALASDIIKLLRDQRV